MGDSENRRNGLVIPAKGVIERPRDEVESIKVKVRVICSCKQNRGSVDSETTRRIIEVEPPEG
jgi:hypothetical protein